MAIRKEVLENIQKTAMMAGPGKNGEGVTALWENYPKDGFRVIGDIAPYKKIEDKIGISLIVLFQALENGIYLKDGAYRREEPDKWFITGIENDIAYFHGDVDIAQFTRYKEPRTVYREEEYCPPDEVEASRDRISGKWERTSIRLEDYGKTWSLTKEAFNKPKTIYDEGAIR